MDYDFKNTVFSFVPNTAESAFFGMIEGLNKKLNDLKKAKIQEMGSDIKSKKLERILAMTTRVEKIIIKDAKLRTFISAGNNRKELVAHGYDITYGIINNNKDTVVLLDDSIVRGTTLKTSILEMVYS